MIRLSSRPAFGSRSRCCANSPPRPPLSGPAQPRVSGTQTVETRSCGNWLAACRRRLRPRQSIETEINRMSENKIGDVVVLKTDTQQQAFYQLADGTSAFLCAIALDDYENPLLRERFFVLATEIVLARIRATGSNVRVIQRDTAPPPEANPNAGVPCWACKSPIA